MNNDLNEKKNSVKWTYQDVVSTLIEIEKANNLLDGVSHHSMIWERLRISVIREIANKVGLHEIPHDRKKEKKSNMSLRLLKYSIISNPFFILKKPKYIFFSHPRRKLTADGLYEDLYTDPLISLINHKSSLSIEKVFKKKHLRPVVTNRIRYLDFIELIIRIRKLIYKHNSKIDKSFFEGIQNQIYNSFNIEIRFIKKAKSIEKNYYLSMPVYKAMFKFLKPEIVFFVCSYGKENQIEAAKSLGIKTVEIQHGVLNSMHLGYSFPAPLRKVSFPDYFLSFGDYWSKYVTLPVPEKNIISLGYPYLTKNFKSHNISDKKNKVVFISQGTIGKELSKIACKYAADQNTTGEIVYKLHPGEYLRWKKEYKELVQASESGLINVVDSDKPSLYSILAESKFAIGVHSTALFEALAFNCKLVIVKLPGYEYMLDLMQSGHVQVVEKDEDIVIDQSKNSFDDINFFFNQDYEKSFRSAVDLISES